MSISGFVRPLERYAVPSSSMNAVGRLATTVLFKGVLPPGRHVVSARASALVNAGPPASARLSFSSR